MKIIDLNNNDIILEKSYIALGNFDGLHIAHMEIIDNLVKESKKDGIASSVLIFKNHTLRELKNSDFEVLTNLDQKINILDKANVDYIYLIDFKDIKDLSPSYFLLFLKEKLKIEGVFVGYDYRFGKGAKASIDELLNNHLNIKIFKQEPVYYNNEVVSSTKIKDLIKNNELSFAEKLLGRSYYIDGIVDHGKKMGSKLGFPTANIKLSENYVLPPEGVYVSQVIINDKKYIAASSLGINYTFNEKIPKIEAHILDFDRIIYDEKISINFIEKIRDMKKFESVDELIEIVNKDISYVRNFRNNL